MKKEIKFRMYHSEKMTENPFLGGNIDIYVNDIFDKVKGVQGDTPIFMQYTGLKDKNGKEIYERDVLTFKKGGFIFEKYCVEYMKNGAMFIARNIKTKQYLNFNATYGDDEKTLDERFEIVGNIHENPELLN